MSAEALVDIQKILLKYKISAKVTTWCENGCATTRILLRDSTGSQFKSSPVDSVPGKKKKSPSRRRRDFRRHKAYLEKKSGLPDSSVPTNAASANLSSRRIATPCRRNVRGHGAPKEIGGSPIPQLDGGDDTSGGGWEGMEGIQSGGNKRSTELNLTRMPDRDFQNLVNEMKKCFEDQRNHKKNDEIEETSFNDAARWAMNQKKKV